MCCNWNHKRGMTSGGGRNRIGVRLRAALEMVRRAVSTKPHRSGGVLGFVAMVEATYGLGNVWGFVATRPNLYPQTPTHRGKKTPPPIFTPRLQHLMSYGILRAIFC